MITNSPPPILAYNFNFFKHAYPPLEYTYPVSILVSYFGFFTLSVILLLQWTPTGSRTSVYRRRNCVMAWKKTFGKNNRSYDGKKSEIRVFLAVLIPILSPPRVELPFVICIEKVDVEFFHSI